jgi:hypothetical protein
MSLSYVGSAREFVVEWVGCHEPRIQAEKVGKDAVGPKKRMSSGEPGIGGGKEGDVETEVREGGSLRCLDELAGPTRQGVMSGGQPGPPLPGVTHRPRFGSVR